MTSSDINRTLGLILGQILTYMTTARRGDAPGTIEITGHGAVPGQIENYARRMKAPVSYANAPDAGPGAARVTITLSDDQIAYLLGERPRP